MRRSVFGTAVGALIGVGAGGEVRAGGRCDTGEPGTMADGHLFGPEELVGRSRSESPAGTAAVVALVEHRWRIPVRDAVPRGRHARGRLGTRRRSDRARSRRRPPRPEPGADLRRRRASAAGRRSRGRGEADPAIAARAVGARSRGGHVRRTASTGTRRAYPRGVQVIYAVTDLARSLDFYERASTGRATSGRLRQLRRAGAPRQRGARPAARGLRGDRRRGGGRAAERPRRARVRLRARRRRRPGSGRLGGRRPAAQPAGAATWGERAAWFADPDGNVVAVAAGPADEPAA